jgi:hypothetical protein
MACVAVISVATAAVLFFGSPYTRISSVTVSDGDAATDAQIESIINASMQGDYLWFIPRDSYFFFPKKMLTQSIPAEFPLVNKVSFSYHGLTGVTADVTDRIPYAIACTGSGDADCYYADGTGVIFQTASSTEGSFIIYRISLPAHTQPLGLNFVDSGRMVAMGGFVGGLARLGFADDDITMSTSTDYDLTLRYFGAGTPSSFATTSEPVMHLIIDESRPLDRTLADFTAFWQQYLRTATNTSVISGLTSVDMRYGDNIVYKVK